MTVEKLYAIARGLNRRFPNGNDLFQIMTRLLEKGGELAAKIDEAYEKMRIEGFIELG